jgi:hypothetical protein
MTDAVPPAPAPEDAPPSPFPKVDALFAGEPPAKPMPAGPRIQRLQRILAVAIPLDLLGIPCWTGVPGAALTLWAYLQADAEMARIEAGAYAGEDAARLLRLRTVSTWALYFCVVSFLVQAWLLSTPYYAMIIGGLWDAVTSGFARL